MRYLAIKINCAVPKEVVWIHGVMYELINNIDRYNVHSGTSLLQTPLEPSELS